MPMQYTASVEIDAPPERVFDAITDPDSLRQWMPNLVSFELLTPEPLGVGGQWKETRKFMGHEASEVFEVTGLEPSRRLELYVDGKKGTTGKGRYDFRFDLEPTSSGTRLMLHGQIDMGPQGFLAKLFSRMMTAMFRKMCLKDMEALKRHVEGVSASV